VKTTQLKTALTVNKELILFYWELGKDISEKMKVANWGDKILRNLSQDLSSAFPNVKGLSLTNLKYCRSFYQFYNFPIGQQAVDQLQSTHNQIAIKSQQLVDQIPWGHNILIFTKINLQY